MSDSTPIDLYAQIHDLVTARILGQITAEQLQRLEQLLAAHTEARQIYVTYIVETVGLQAMLGATGEAEAADDMRPTVRPHTPELGFLHTAAKRMRKKYGDLRVNILLAGIVVAFLAGAAAGTIMLNRSRPAAQPEVAGSGEQGAASGVSPRPGAVARLTRTVDCVWADGVEAPQVGDDLEAGGALVLESGLAEIVFRDGARTLLQGPATLETQTRGSAFLHLGKCTITVETPSSRGFQVRTPGMTYTDLGTEFGVLVAQSGAQEVHVFRGRVQAEEAESTEQGTGSNSQGAGSAEQDNLPSASGKGAGPAPSREGARIGGGSHRSSLILSTHQAIRVTEPGKPIQLIAANEKQFVRTIPEPLPLYSTGVGLDRGAADPHWEITAISSDRKFTPRQAVVIVPPASYLPDAREKAQWLAEAKVPATMPNSCRWTLRTRFDLTGFDPATARIEGLAAVDNYLIAMRLNGKQVPLPRVPRQQWFERRTPIQVESGFTAGINTLEIVIENAVSANPYNPMAICLEWRGTATRTAKQEDAKH